MTTWAELLPEFDMFLGIREDQLEDPEKIFLFNRAQTFFGLSHTAKRLSVTFSGDGSTMEFDLPADIIQAYAVFDETAKQILEPVDLAPGIMWDEEGASDTYRPYGWMPWPEGKLRLLRAPDTGTDNIKLYYWGLWPEVADGTSVIGPPLWAHEALLLYALSLSLLDKIMDSSDVRQWNTRIDSGRPTDNPLVDAHWMLMKRYETVLAPFPRQVRKFAFRKGGRG